MDEDVMLRSNTGIFLHIPGESTERILHPAVIIGVRGKQYSARAEETALDVEVGREVLIYHEVDRVFMMQTARIEGILQTEPAWMIVFETIGDPVSAESRQSYRVCTAVADLSAKLGSESGCQVLDVSTTGFSAMARRRYPPGAVLAAVMRFEDQQFSGTVTVQSIRSHGPDHYRYGCQVVTDRLICGGKLAKGLEQISSTLQHRHLRRLRGSG